jgi:NTE family protein
MKTINEGTNSSYSLYSLLGSPFVEGFLPGFGRMKVDDRITGLEGSSAMKKNLAFVLGGGGGRGALQAGALRALFEADIYPDMLVGTSAGAVNAAYLAMRGVNLAGVDALEKAWLVAAGLNLFPANFLWLSIRALFNRPTPVVAHRLQEFFLSQGLSPEMRFADITGVRAYLVAADLSNGKTVVYGRDSQENLMEGLLASTALPPWVSPIEKPDQRLIDGGAVSTLPIEPALSQGATEIIALDLQDNRMIPTEAQGFGPFMAQVINTVENRQKELELALAAARGVRVRLVHLEGPEPTPLWDFTRSAELIECGYRQMWRAIDNWEIEHRPPWLAWLSHRLQRKSRPPRKS